MIVEFLFLATLLASGLWIVPTSAAARPLERASTAFLGGTGVYIVVGVVLAVTALPTHPYATLSLTAAICVAIGLITRPKPSSNGSRNLATLRPTRLISLALFFVATAFIVVISRRLDFVRVTPDSYDYSTVAGLIHRQSISEASFWLLQNRLLPVGILHSPGPLNGEHYITSITPAISLAMILLLYSIITDARSAARWPRRQVGALAVVLVIALAASPMYLFQTMYINAHMMIAAMVLLSIGILWRSVERSEPLEARALTLVVIGVSVVSLARPEGGLLSVLILLPVVASGQLRVSARRAPLAAAGATVTMWHAYLVYRSTGGRSLSAVEPPSSVVAMLAVGIAALLGSCLVGSRFDTGASRRLIFPIAGGVVLLVLIRLGASDPSNLTTSWDATVANLTGDGLWGYSVLALTLLGILLPIARRIKSLALWFSILLFLPMMLIMAYLREVPYRIGSGDSLNRSWLHILPIVALSIASAALTARVQKTTVLSSSTASLPERSLTCATTTTENPAELRGSRT